VKTASLTRLSPCPISSTPTPDWLHVALTHLIRSENVSTPPTPPLLFLRPTFLPPSQSSVRSIHFGPLSIYLIYRSNFSQSLLCNVRRHVSGVSWSLLRYAASKLTHASFFDIEWKGPVLNEADEPTKQIEGKCLEPFCPICPTLRLSVCGHDSALRLLGAVPSRCALSERIHAAGNHFSNVQEQPLSLYYRTGQVTS
jgi:hypothetical protein